MSVQPPTNAFQVAIFIDFQMRNAYCAGFKPMNYEMRNNGGKERSTYNIWKHTFLLLAVYITECRKNKLGNGAQHSTWSQQTNAPMRLELDISCHLAEFLSFALPTMPPSMQRNIRCKIHNARTHTHTHTHMLTCGYKEKKFVRM